MRNTLSKGPLSLGSKSYSSSSQQRPESLTRVEQRRVDKRQIFETM